MEAAPKLPMLSFDLNICTENVQFGPQLKKYIGAFYGEDPDSYITEINNLEALRAAAVRPTMDVDGVQLLKKYYCQLHFLKSRFPMEENQDAAVQFSWKNNQLESSYSSTDIRYELMVIMYNIGALHSYLGASDSRINQEGMKMSCTHFQCAAWAFQMVKEQYHQFIVYVSLVELVHFFQQVSLAQAQECILEKSMFDNRKPTIIAKVAVQVYSYYRQSLSILESVNEDYFRDKISKEWRKFLQFKISYYKCIALLYQGQQAEEQQKMGERVAYYQAASEQLDEAKKIAATLKNQNQQQEINEGLSFTTDVVEGKRKAAKNENEFIYHESVPDKDQLEEIKGASLVKGIPFSINDSEVSGSDIFSRLVPMEAHEAASLYSEKKAQILREIGELIESKDQALAEFMSSMHLDLSNKMHQATGIPQELIDRAAALSARPAAVQELVNAMGKLSNIYQDVEANLNEIDTLLKLDEESEKVYEEKIGKRPATILVTDLTREAAKYREAHSKANESNQTLHRAMTAHAANLKILQQPLKQLQMYLPFVELPNPNINEKSLQHLDSLVAKVEEMRNQRAMLWAQLRETLHNDDITSSLVTKQPNQSLEQLFQQELEKHQQLISLIEQNTTAQENIKKALIDAYAQSVTTRKYIQEIIQKRSTTISSLITSYDSYEDLLSKANKGIEFYTKLETNVSKLLQRVKSTCKVQQEEREQVLGTTEVPLSKNDTPKLKDYLESRKTYNLQYQNETRPTPVGSEVTLPHYQYNEEDFLKKMNLNYSSPYINSDMKSSQASATKAFTSTTNTYKQLQTSSGHLQYPSSSSSTSTNYNQHSVTSTNTTNYHQNVIKPIDVTNYHTTTSNYPNNQLEHNINIYYPQGYAPIDPSRNENLDNKYFTGSSNIKYHSVEYATSVQSPIFNNLNNSSIYSSPLSNVSNSTNSGTGTDVNYQYQNVSGYYNTNPYMAVGQNYTSQIQQVDGTNTHINTYIPSSINQYYTSTSTQQINPNLTHQQINPNIPSQQLNQNVTPQQMHQNLTSQQINSNLTSQQINQNITPQQIHPNMPSQQINPNLTPQQMNPNITPQQINPNITPQQLNPNLTQQYMNSNLQSQQMNPNLPPQQINPNIYYSQASYYNYSTTLQQPSTTVQQPKTTSNIDLLSGLDFNISQPPLVPQQQQQPHPQQKVVSNNKEPEITNKSTPTPVIVEIKRPIVKILPSKPLNNKDVKNLFNQELERYEKFVETLTNKTLNGPTNLELKWKEIQDQQEFDGQKKIISVARCYPMKNRYPDILPYDYSRVELCDSKDDYINASYIKDISPYSPPFIVTQLPLSGTIGDFWTMIREQQVELILCLQNDNEIGDEIYWPKEKDKSINILNMVISLQSIIKKTHWIERLICINLPEKRESRVILHLQFTSWPGSLFPTSPEPFVNYILESINMYQQQKSNTHPIVVHCSSGIGKSGLICLLTAAIFDVANNANSIPDLNVLTVKLSSCRKNILRYREHLKFAYECFLAYMHQVVSEDKSKKKMNEVEAPKIKEEELPQLQVNTDKNIDPLSTLDPFWASKK